MKIGVIVAMQKELDRLKEQLDHGRTEQHNGRTFVVGRIGPNDIIVQQCGIGKVNSAIGAVEMIFAYRPQLIVSTGVAGGADITLNPADTVVSTACTYHDAYCGAECEAGQIVGLPATYPSPQTLVDQALAMRADNAIRAGLIVSGDWFVDSRDKMQQILDQFPAATAVDMESCSIAQTCHIYRTPFISFRIISDVPLKDREAAQYYDFWERLAESSFRITKTFLQTIQHI